MNIIHRIIAASAALVLLGTAVQADAPGDDITGTLCTNEDYVYFSARSTVSGKLVSICMTWGDDSTPNHLTYRYGTPEKLEMVYPPKAAGSEKKFTIRRYTRPQTHYLKLHFQKDGYDYAILEASEGAESETILRVMRVSDEKIVLEHMVEPKKGTGFLMELEDLVPMAPFDE